jgi:hypothetical protein
LNLVKLFLVDSSLHLSLLQDECCEKLGLFQQKVESLLSCLLGFCASLKLFFLLFDEHTCNLLSLILLFLQFLSFESALCLDLLFDLGCGNLRQVLVLIFTPWTFIFHLNVLLSLVNGCRC